MSEARPHQIHPHHLRRKAINYMRQSSERQVIENQGSTAHQRSQTDFARRWGWPESLIEEIDDDLGVTGTSTGKRMGWQRLLKLVAQGEVGLILFGDTSRLSRSIKDFAVLLGLCNEMDVLLASDGSIMDPKDSGSRFALTVFAAAAEFGNDSQTERMMNARRSLAQNGLAVSACPTGYVRTDKGKWSKDPDPEVQNAIEAVFRQYLALGSQGKLLRFLKEHHLKLPARRGYDSLNWNEPTKARIQHILGNPAYRGAYVLGRTATARGVRHGKLRRTDPAEWIVIEDHHEGYITAAEWAEIQDRLRQNQVRVKQPAGNSAALCQGIIRCGKCNRAMSVHFNPTRRGGGYGYRCDRAYMALGEPSCWQINGPPLDAAVVRELFGCLPSLAEEDVRAAGADFNAGYEAAQRQREVELERAEYEVRLAKRRFEAIDPENATLIRTLAKEYDLALARQQKIVRSHAETPLARPLDLTSGALDAIRQLSLKLPEVRAAPSTTNQNRKSLLRIFVPEVRVVGMTRVQFEVEIHWIGGRVTRHALFREKIKGLVVQELKAQGLTIPQIAAELNRRGLRTRLYNKPFTPNNVNALLRVYQYWQRERSPREVFRSHWETLRPIVSELFNAGATDEAIAVELNRRGLKPFYKDTWDPTLVAHLRHNLGLRRSAQTSGQRKRAAPEAA